MATSQQLRRWASAKGKKGPGLLQASPDWRTGKHGKSGGKEEKKRKGKGGRGGKEEEKEKGEKRKKGEEGMKRGWSTEEGGGGMQQA